MEVAADWAAVWGATEGAEVAAAGATEEARMAVIRERRSERCTIRDMKRCSDRTTPICNNIRYRCSKGRWRDTYRLLLSLHPSLQLAGKSGRAVVNLPVVPLEAMELKVGCRSQLLRQ